jgi:hypothetical protein
VNEEDLFIQGFYFHVLCVKLNLSCCFIEVNKILQIKTEMHLSKKLNPKP